MSGSIGDVFDRMRLDAERRQAELEASPNRCTRGCGAKVLRSTDTCETCTEARRKEADGARRRADATRATIEALQPRYRWAHFGAPELRARVRDHAALELVQHEGPDAERVILSGAAGLGKTVLAACLLRLWAERHGRRGLMLDAFVLGAARAQHGLGEGDAKDVVRAMRAGALLLDDLGAEKPTLQSAIPDTLHHRHAEMLPTIVTTGYGRDGLLEKYGDGILRRLREGALVVEMTPAKRA
jgi:DNA replication protein DnaC